MLINLFSSQTRVDLLNLFFNHPDERFYMREIARLIKYDISGVKRELDNLEKLGLLQSERAGNLRYFWVNKNSPLFAEFKNIIFKTTGIQGALKRALSKFRGIRVAFIYGSYAQGTERKLSDINLLIVGKVNLPHLNATILGLEEQLKREINYLVFDEAEFRRRKRQRDPFLKGLLRGRKVMLVGREDDL